MHSCWRVCIYHWTKDLRCDTPCSSGSVFIAKTGFVKPVTLVTVQESLCSPSQWQWGQLFELIDRGISLFPSYLLRAGGTRYLSWRNWSRPNWRHEGVKEGQAQIRVSHSSALSSTRAGSAQDPFAVDSLVTFGARRSVGKNAGITKFDVEHRNSLECQRSSSVDRKLQGAGMGARDKLDTTRRRSSEGDCRARQQKNDRTDEIGAKH